MGCALANGLPVDPAPATVPSDQTMTDLPPNEPAPDGPLSSAHARIGWCCVVVGALSFLAPTPVWWFGLAIAVSALAWMRPAWASLGDARARERLSRWLPLTLLLLLAGGIRSTMHYSHGYVSTLVCVCVRVLLAQGSARRIP